MESRRVKLISQPFGGWSPDYFTPASFSFYSSGNRCQKTSIENKYKAEKKNTEFRT